jgi:hypothetical protein
MLCDKCSTIIDDKFNKVCYSCGHRYHRTCLLVNKYSLLNPSCDICDDGKIIRNSLQYDFKNLEKVESVASSNVVAVVNSKEVVKEDLEVDEVAILEFGKKEIVHSSKILLLIFCTVYFFTPFLNS